MYKRLSVLVISAFLLSGCSYFSNEIRNLELLLNTEFQGTVTDIKTEPVLLKWNTSKISNDENYLLQITFPDLYSGETFELEFDNSYNPLIIDGTSHSLELYQSFGDYSLFGNFISLNSNTNVTISLSKVNKGNKSQEQLITWTRPPRTSIPMDPILISSWKNSGDGYYEYTVRDVSELTFNSYPLNEFRSCKGVCEKLGINPSPFPWLAPYGVFNYNVKGVKQVLVGRQVGNELGLSASVALKMTSNPSEIGKVETLENPWTRKWTSKDMEALAKTAWCISNGYKDYSRSTDECKE